MAEVEVLRWVEAVQAYRVEALLLWAVGALRQLAVEALLQWVVVVKV